MCSLIYGNCNYGSEIINLSWVWQESKDEQVSVTVACLGQYAAIFCVVIMPGMPMPLMCNRGLALGMWNIEVTN